MQVEFFHRYLQDFISLMTNLTTEVELKVSIYKHVLTYIFYSLFKIIHPHGNVCVCMSTPQLLAGALTCCVNEVRSRQEAVQNDVTSLPWIHAAYHEFKNRLQNFSRMITIEPQIAQVLLGNKQSREGMEMVSCTSHYWLRGCKGCNDYTQYFTFFNLYLPQVLDVYAAMACVEYLEPQGLDAFTNCVAWLRQVKKLQVPIELVCSEESIRHYGERSKTMIGHVQ